MISETTRLLLTSQRRRLLAPAAVAAVALGVPTLFTGTAFAASTSASVAAAAPRPLAHEEAAARARFAVTSRQPHAGKAEALTHPSADGLGASGATGVHAAAARSAQTPSPPPQTSSSPPVSGPLGIDVANYQGNVNWTEAVNDDIQFAYVKATEGTYYVDGAYFTEQYEGSYNAGIIRGAYHFAIPDNSTGAAQADYFVANGGGWSADGHTLPGMLDLEFNPYGAECYGLTPTQMVAWVASFDSEYLTLTGRYPVMYTNTKWWDTCTGGSSVADQDPLDIANYGSSPSPLPEGWSIYTIWQYTDSNAMDADGDVFDGTYSDLQALALGHPLIAAVTTYAIASGNELRYNFTDKLTSPNGEYELLMQTDGNLVEYSAGKPLWSTGTSGNPGAFLVMQNDGNLVLYGSTGQALWSTRTSGHGKSRLVMQSDGNVVVSTIATGKPTWANGR